MNIPKCRPVSDALNNSLAALRAATEVHADLYKAPEQKSAALLACCLKLHTAIAALAAHSEQESP